MAAPAQARRIVRTMPYRAVLRGYLLEEALAWLLRNTGYRILEHKDDDPDELDMRGEVLLVKGRGASTRWTSSASSRLRRHFRCQSACYRGQV